MIKGRVVEDMKFVNAPTIKRGTLVEIIRKTEYYDDQQYLLCKLPNGQNLEFSERDLERA